MQYGNILQRGVPACLEVMIRFAPVWFCVLSFLTTACSRAFRAPNSTGLIFTLVRRLNIARSSGTKTKMSINLNMAHYYSVIISNGQFKADKFALANLRIVEQHRFDSTEPGCMMYILRKFEFNRKAFRTSPPCKRARNATDTSHIRSGAYRHV